ncbi:hypothetical protein [Gilvimarinus agarilyticus]|uniref:hypothetical protein n=1 Tax=Gilvimarinus agarilyticus TaxID=679259 RepID=UPI0012F9DE59|nr:hypothetical protein [Gilvimarinus agarilyticus]
MTDAKKDTKAADAKPATKQPAPKKTEKITRTDNSKNGYVEARRNQRRRARK